MHYKTIICGGTFDHLHKGHEVFLSYAFSHAEAVIIGLTSDTYTSIFKKDLTIQPFVKRKEQLESFLQNEGFFKRARIVSIDSKFDQTQIPTKDSALLVSQETKKTGEEINRERQKKNLFLLPILTVPLIKTYGKKISSSRIRQGKIDRNGVAIPEDIRKVLHKPFGKLIPREIPGALLSHPEKIITVGDATTKRFNAQNTGQKISIIDLAVRREKIFTTIKQLGFIGDEHIFYAKNPPGHITKDIWTQLAKMVQKLADSNRYILQVDGEEDLAVIPLIALLPISYTIFYGQPDKGIVAITITNVVKEKVEKILKKSEEYSITLEE